jgi:hypothetical protein
MKYINDKELTKELIISKGKGKATPRLNELLILLADNIIRKKHFNNITDRHDVYTDGLIQLLTNWKFFNHKKYDSGFIYLTEVMKRGMASGYNKIKGMNNKIMPNFIYIDSYN